MSTSKGPMDCLKVQAQIRANAEEMQDYLSELKQWEKTIEKKDRQVRRGREGGLAKAAPVRASCGTVGVYSCSSSTAAAQASKAQTRKPATMSKSSSSSKKEKKKKQSGGGAASSSSSTTAAGHTYDKGYSKWEKFDVDAALQAADDQSEDEDEEEEEEDDDTQGSGEPEGPAVVITPATITAQASKFQVDKSKVVKPRPRAQSDADMEAAEREKGNEHYRKGEFSLAVRCYTRCIGFNSQSVVSFSNRAMAYLKLREFTKAEQDATIALTMDPTHVKSLHRRASARSSRGMYRAALLDLEAALVLQPSSRDLLVELRKAKEMFRASLRRAPHTQVPIQVVASATPPQASPPPPPAAEQHQLLAAEPQGEREVTVTATDPKVVVGEEEEQQPPLGPSCPTSEQAPPPPPQDEEEEGQSPPPSPSLSAPIAAAAAAGQEENVTPPPPPPDAEAIPTPPTPTPEPSTIISTISSSSGRCSSSSSSAGGARGMSTTSTARTTASSKGNKKKAVAPKTLFELQRAWRSLGGSSLRHNPPSSSSGGGGGGGGRDGQAMVLSRRVQYLRETVRPAGLSRVLATSSSMEPDLLGEVIQAIHAAFITTTTSTAAAAGEDDGGSSSKEEGEGEEVMSWLQAVSKAGPMAMMLLEANTKQALHQLLHLVLLPSSSSSSPEVVEQLRRDLKLEQ